MITNKATCLLVITASERVLGDMVEHINLCIRDGDAVDFDLTYAECYPFDEFPDIKQCPNTGDYYCLFEYDHEPTQWLATPHRWLQETANRFKFASMRLYVSYQHDKDCYPTDETIIITPRTEDNPAAPLSNSEGDQTYPICLDILPRSPIWEHYKSTVLHNKENTNAGY